MTNTMKKIEELKMGLSTVCHNIAFYGERATASELRAMIEAREDVLAELAEYPVIWKTLI